MPIAAPHHRSRARPNSLARLCARVALFVYVVACAPTFVYGIASNQIQPGNIPQSPIAPEPAQSQSPASATITNTKRNKHSYPQLYPYENTTQLDWLSRDPLGEQGGLNLYGFVGNDPINKWDYLGLDTIITGIDARVPLKAIGEILMATPKAVHSVYRMLVGATGDPNILNPVGLSPMNGTYLRTLSNSQRTTEWDEGLYYARTHKLDFLPLGGPLLRRGRAVIRGGIEIALPKEPTDYYRLPEFSRQVPGTFSISPGMQAKMSRSAESASIINPFAPAPRTPVWSKNPLQRGVDIEDALAATDYKDWFRAGQLNNGYFPLVDFQKGRNLVSLTTVDTGGASWMGRMQDHIRELSLGHTVDGKAANMILDMRVQPGGAGAAESLIEFGSKRGVTVRISEYP